MSESNDWQEGGVSNDLRIPVTWGDIARAVWAKLCGRGAFIGSVYSITVRYKSTEPVSMILSDACLIADKRPERAPLGHVRAVNMPPLDLR